jgi:cytoskeletal protein CcmA (bactofilin family)
MSDAVDAVARPGSKPVHRTQPLLAAGAGFTGLLHVEGGARIDGELEGEIVASDTVWIGASGRVRARVEAPRIVVAGELEGVICASAKVELEATARVRAVLETPLLVLAEGAFFEGRCRAGASRQEPAAGAPKSPNSTHATP